ncbi:MAG: transporter substrate-binding domain-containing protein, partial [Eubacteriales bacterium]|nr:transporter substrate-binding domain-containing protein [Eubacteriales bacterium]
MSKVCKTFVLIISVILTATGICFYSEISISALEDISLTVEEINFIETHPVIIVGVDPKFVPFEFIDDEGDYKGIAADHLDLISELTGLRFEVQRGITWPEAYDRALSGEIDLLPAVSVTEERKLYFRFSEPYHNFRRVIVTRNN